MRAATLFWVLLVQDMQKGGAMRRLCFASRSGLLDNLRHRLCCRAIDLQLAIIDTQMYHATLR